MLPNFSVDISVLLQCLLCMCVVYFQCWFLCVAYFQCWCQCVLPTFCSDVTHHHHVSEYIFSVLISVYVHFFSAICIFSMLMSVYLAFFQCWYQCVFLTFSVDTVYVYCQFSVCVSIFSDISGNQLTSVPSGVFQGLSALTRLWVHTVFCPFSYSR